MDFLYTNYPNFEYDPTKSQANLIKHGIDFIQAQQLWLDQELLVIQVMTEPEKRYLAIGKIGIKHWSAIFTERNGNIRLISVRRAKKKRFFIMRNNINHNEFDQKFDNNEDISEFLDLSTATRVNQQIKRVNVDFPSWMVERLDQQASYLNVPRQALIKLWIAEKLGEL